MFIYQTHPTTDLVFVHINHIQNHINVLNIFYIGIWDKKFIHCHHSQMKYPFVRWKPILWPLSFSRCPLICQSLSLDSGSSRKYCIQAQNVQWFYIAIINWRCGQNHSAIHHHIYLKVLSTNPLSFNFKEQVKMFHIYKSL